MAFVGAGTDRQSHVLGVFDTLSSDDVEMYAGTGHPSPGLDIVRGGEILPTAAHDMNLAFGLIDPLQSSIRHICDS